jgi:hypothetical protein
MTIAMTVTTRLLPLCLLLAASRAQADAPSCYSREPAPEEKGPVSPRPAGAPRGSLDKEIIRRVIRRHIGEVKACYDAALAKQPGLSARVMIRFVISATGAVTRSEPQSSTVDLPALVDCIGQAACGWTFPKPLGGGTVTVSYPFVLTSGSATPASGDLGNGVRVELIGPALYLYSTVADEGTSAGNGLVAVTDKGMLLVDTPRTNAQAQTLLSWGQHALNRGWMGAILSTDHPDRDEGLKTVIRRGIPVRALGSTVAQLSRRAIVGPTALVASPTRIWAEGSYEVFDPGAGGSPEGVVVFFREPSVLFAGPLLVEPGDQRPRGIDELGRTRWREAVARVAARYPHPGRIVVGRGPATASPTYEDTLDRLAADRR